MIKNTGGFPDVVGGSQLPATLAAQDLMPSVGLRLHHIQVPIITYKFTHTTIIKINILMVP